LASAFAEIDPETQAVRRILDRCGGIWKDRSMKYRILGKTGLKYQRLAMALGESARAAGLALPTMSP
jgi:hypothetical protein